MTTSIKANLPLGTILKNHGLEKGGKVQRFMTNEVYKLSMPYTPFDSSTLSTTVDLEANSITYKSIYAKYQWSGKVMVGSAPKQPTNKELTYQGAPKRGKEWTNRAMADHKEELIKSVEDFIKKE
jgi:hypothetical protein